MSAIKPANDLDALWNAIPTLLEQQAADWALREVLDAGTAGYTCDEDTPEGLMIRHDPNGTRYLVRINLDGPDTVIRRL